MQHSLGRMSGRGAGQDGIVDAKDMTLGARC